MLRNAGSYYAQLNPERRNEQLPEAARQVLANSEKTKVLHLEGRIGRKKTKDQEKRVLKGVNKELKKKGLFYVEKLPFADAVLLNGLWRQYIASLFKIGSGGEIPVAQKLMRLAQGDWHGAFVRVAVSKDPTLVGVSGIIVQDTKNTLRLATEKERLITLLKKAVVLEMHVGPIESSRDDQKFMIYARQAQIAPDQRSKLKLKAKPMVSLF
eukprot:Polyplicarium_translucidae@DN215_c0_g1_i1.p1